MLKPYPKYKDSGIEWIGYVPELWDIKPLRRVIRDKADGIKIGPFGSQLKLDEMVETGYKVYGQENVIANDFQIGKRFIDSKKYSELSVCSINPGDILITMMGTSGRCQIVPEGISEGIMDSHLIRLRVNEKNAIIYFISLVIERAYYIKQQINLLSKGSIMQGLNSFIIKELTFALPSISEQIQIITFLDHQTSRIDSLITSLTRKIELLKEYRTALINEVVTRGLNPNVKMKDSGIEWLGEVPEHWEIKRLKYLCDITTGNRDTQDSKEDGMYPFFVRSDNVERIDTYSFDGEAILTAGDGVGVAKVFHYYNGKFEFHQRVYMLSNFKKIKARYLFHYIKENFYKAVLQLSAKSTVDSLRLPMFNNFMVCVPSQGEQKEIELFLNDKTSQIDSLVDKEQKKIDRLKEYRTALISEVVTGKVDVRDAVLNN